MMKGRSLLLGLTDPLVTVFLWLEGPDLARVACCAPKARRHPHLGTAVRLRAKQRRGNVPDDSSRPDKNWVIRRDFHRSTVLWRRRRGTDCSTLTTLPALEQFHVEFEALVKVGHRAACRCARASQKKFSRSALLDAVLPHNPKALKYLASTHPLRDDASYVANAVKKQAGLFHAATPRLRGDKDFVLRVLRNGASPYEVCHSMAPHFLDDADIAHLLICGSYFKYHDLSSRLRSLPAIRALVVARARIAGRRPTQAWFDAPKGTSMMNLMCLRVLR